jgi:hypothetical protein
VCAGSSSGSLVSRGSPPPEWSSPASAAPTTTINPTSFVRGYIDGSPRPPPIPLTPKPARRQESSSSVADSALRSGDSTARQPNRHAGPGYCPAGARSVARGHLRRGGIAAGALGGPSTAFGCRSPCATIPPPRKATKSASRPRCSWRTQGRALVTDHSVSQRDRPGAAASRLKRSCVRAWLLPGTTSRAGAAGLPGVALVPVGETTSSRICSVFDLEQATSSRYIGTRLAPDRRRLRRCRLSSNSGVSDGLGQTPAFAGIRQSGSSNVIASTALASPARAVISSP